MLNTKAIEGMIHDTWYLYGTCMVPVHIYILRSIYVRTEYQVPVFLICTGINDAGVISVTVDCTLVAGISLGLRVRTDTGCADVGWK